ncbi:PREDICTED: uncharacterized protein LOC105450020 isoform X2 [Wasmannia auropunctata]|uniref:uncharacterized protein LOC105450020 isoform X2 n=1 Tax=Wasmannia auropunctata TaxID=64793 RepID=UPI0005EDDE2D|nr:PREDICTED: uncharacterized protein LOC105450020 isoform X2 [Wasmannia auropunctata]
MEVECAFVLWLRLAGLALARIPLGDYSLEENYGEFIFQPTAADRDTRRDVTCASIHLIRACQVASKLCEIVGGWLGASADHTRTTTKNACSMLRDDDDGDDELTRVQTSMLPNEVLS